MEVYKYWPILVPRAWCWPRHCEGRARPGADRTFTDCVQRTVSIQSRSPSLRSLGRKRRLWAISFPEPAILGKETKTLGNLIPRACDPREGTRGSGIIRCRKPGILAKIELRIHFNGQSDSSLKRFIPEPRVPSRGSQARGTRLGSGIIISTMDNPNQTDTEGCMSTELRMRWQKQNKLFEIFYCFVYKMMIFSGIWWKCWCSS
jgi:hypothetical protein